MDLENPTIIIVASVRARLMFGKFIYEIKVIKNSSDVEQTLLKNLF